MVVNVRTHLHHGDGSESVDEAWREKTHEFDNGVNHPVFQPAGRAFFVRRLQSFEGHVTRVQGGYDSVTDVSGSTRKDVERQREHDPWKNATS